MKRKFMLTIRSFMLLILVVAVLASCAPPQAPVAEPPASTEAPAAPAAPTAPAAAPATEAPAAATEAPTEAVVMDEGPKDGGTVTIAVNTSPGGNFNPGLAPSSYTALINHLIYPTLFRWNSEGTDTLGSLVETWEQNEDFTKITFNIYEDAVWSDGQPITTEDIEFTLWALSHPEIESNRGGVIQWIAGLENSKRPAGVETIEGVNIIDSNTIELTFIKPMAEITITEPLGLWMEIIPKHVLKDIPAADFNNAEFWLNPTVNGGPFRFVEYRTDEYVKMVRNPDYFLGSPHIDTLIVKVVNSATLGAQLEKGEIDMTAGTLSNVPLEDWERVKSLDYITTYVEGLGRGQRLQMNCEAGRPFENAKARQALGYAINRQLMLDKIFQGMGIITDNAKVAPPNPYYNPDVDGIYTYDPEKAKQLLAEANFDFSKTVDLLVPTGDTSRELTGDIIMANLQDIGINVNLRKYDYATMLTYVRKGKKDYDLGMVGGGVDIDPQMSYFEALYSGGPYNYAYCDMPDLDVLIDELSETIDYDQRVDVLHRIQEQFIIDYPFVHLYYPTALNAANSRVHNLVFPNGYMAFISNVHEWWVDDGK